MNQKLVLIFFLFVIVGCSSSAIEFKEGHPYFKERQIAIITVSYDSDDVDTYSLYTMNYADVFHVKISRDHSCNLSSRSYNPELYRFLIQQITTSRAKSVGGQVLFDDSHLKGTESGWWYVFQDNGEVTTGTNISMIIPDGVFTPLLTTYTNGKVVPATQWSYSFLECKSLVRDIESVLLSSVPEPI